MKKNLLLLLALSAGTFTLWSQEPSYECAETSEDGTQQVAMPKYLIAPENVYISGMECRLDKYIKPNERMDEYIYQGNSILCNRYEYDWSTNDWRYALRAFSDYNEDGRLTLYETYFFNPSTNQWVGQNKYEYQYDMAGRMTVGVKYCWSETSNDWYCMARNENNFSEHGQKVSSISWIGNEASGTLRGKSKTESVLNDNERVVENINYAWDSQKNDWVVLNKETYTYNSRGLTTECVVEKWNQSTLSWDQSQGRILEYLYNGHGRKESILEKHWNNAAQEWQVKYITSFGYDLQGHPLYRVKALATSEDPLNGFEKDTYEYNDQHQVINHCAYAKSKDNDEWWLTSKDEFTYDDFRNVSSFTRLRWSDRNSESFGWQKWERGYSEDRKVNMKADYNWDAQSKSWVGRTCQEFEKDNMGLDLRLYVTYGWKPEGWYQYSYDVLDFDFDNFVATITEFETNSNKVLAQEYYYYKPINTTGINEVFTQEAPAFVIEGNNVVTPDNNFISIYSIDGKLVNASNGKATIPAAGFYIVKVGEQATKVYIK